MNSIIKNYHAYYRKESYKDVEKRWRQDDASELLDEIDRHYVKREKNWSQRKHEEKVFDEYPADEVYHVVKHLGYDTKDKKQTVVGKISKSQLNNIYPLHKKNNNSLA